MPALSLFFGIIIRMYSEPNGRHNLPHIHAQYQDDEAVFSLDGEMIEGSVPNRQRKLIVAWMEIHHEDLLANWSLLQEGQELFRIAPLQ